MVWLTMEISQSSTNKELDFGSEISKPARDGPAPRLKDTVWYGG
jgi:hypothetical protein